MADKKKVSHGREVSHEREVSHGKYRMEWKPISQPPRSFSTITFSFWFARLSRSSINTDSFFVISLCFHDTFDYTTLHCRIQNVYSQKYSLHVSTRIHTPWGCVKSNKIVFVSFIYNLIVNCENVSRDWLFEIGSEEKKRKIQMSELVWLLHDHNNF